MFLGDIPFYHGSPYAGMVLEEFVGKFFVTPSMSVARDYLVPLVGTGRKPYDDVEEVKTLYTIGVNLDEVDIFNTTEPEDRRLYYKIREDLKKELDWEDWPSRDLQSTPRLRDASLVICGDLPDYGAGIFIRKYLKEMGFRGMWVAEGSQGASLLLFYTKYDAEIIRAECLECGDLFDALF